VGSPILLSFELRKTGEHSSPPYKETPVGLLLGVIITAAVIAKTNNDFGNWLSNDVYSFIKSNVNHLLKR